MSDYKCRNKFLKIRISQEEKNRLDALAAAEDKTVADLLRGLIDAKPTNLPRKRKRMTRQADPALIREIARVGNNLNQIAKWANTHKETAETVEVLAALVEIEQQFAELKCTLST